MNALKRGLSFALALICANSSSAQTSDFLPLLEVLPNSTNGYPYVRCAALYATIAEVLEKYGDVLSEEEQSKADRLVGMHLVFAHLYRSFPPPVDGEVDESVTRDADQISDLYRAHLLETYSKTGRLQSAMTLQDLEVCKALEDQAIK